MCEQVPPGADDHIRAEMSQSGYWFQYLDVETQTRADRAEAKKRSFYASEDFLGLYGYSSLEEMPQRRIDLVQPDDQARVRRVINRTVEQWRKHPDRGHEESLTFKI